MHTYIETFENQLNEMLELMVPENEQASIKNDLYKNVYLDLGSRLLDAATGLNEEKSSEVMQALNKMGEESPLGKEMENSGEFKKHLDESHQIIDSLGLDFNSELEASCKAVMTDFISKISPEIPLEQLEKLKTIFE